MGGLKQTYYFLTLEKRGEKVDGANNMKFPISFSRIEKTLYIIVLPVIMPLITKI